MYELRPYQKDCIERARVALQDPDRPCRRLILESPTGSGKTVIASHLIDRAVTLGKRVLFLAHSRELVHQAAEKLQKLGVYHGIIMRGMPYNPNAPVQVASKDTLYVRGLRKVGARALDSLPPADLLILDECHRSVAKTWKRLLDAYPNAVAIGLTATPARADGKGLGDIWHRIIKVDTYENLVKNGFLVPTRVFAPWAPDLKGVRTKSTGDYRESDLEDRVAKRAIVGRVVDHLLEHAPGMSTIVFCVTINHSLMVLDELRDRGVVAEHVDGEMDTNERDHILHMFKERRVQVVTNCMVLTEGFDAPHCQCAVIARPTRSIVLWRQMAGRIQRPSPEKDSAMIIDMAGAVYQHGFPDDDMEWVLTETEKVTRLRDQRPADGPGQIRVCKNCGFVVRERVRFCPECGAILRSDRKPVEHKPGKVAELQRRRAVPASKDTMQAYWYKCIGMAIGKNAKIGMAAHLYRARFNVWPRDLKHVPKGKEQWQMQARDYYAKAIRSG